MKKSFPIRSLVLACIACGLLPAVGLAQQKDLIELAIAGIEYIRSEFPEGPFALDPSYDKASVPPGIVKAVAARLGVPTRPGVVNQACQRSADAAVTACSLGDVDVVVAVKPLEIQGDHASLVISWAFVEDGRTLTIEDAVLELERKGDGWMVTRVTGRGIS